MLQVVGGISTNFKTVYSGKSVGGAEMAFFRPNLEGFRLISGNQGLNTCNHPRMKGGKKYTLLDKLLAKTW